MSAIDESLREVQYKEKDGYPYIIHELLDGVPRVSQDLLVDWAAWALEQPLLAEATLLVAPEAMGIHLAVPITLATGTPYVVARKREYGLPGELVAYCETGYSQSCIYVNDVKPGDKVVVIDDVVSTGGTLTAMLTTLKEAGAEVLGALVAIGKGDGAAKVREATGLPVHTMRHIAIVDGEFVVSRD